MISAVKRNKTEKGKSFFCRQAETILNKVLKKGNTEKMAYEQGLNRDEEDHNRLPREKVFQAQEAIIIKVQKKHASHAVRRAEQLVCLERKEQRERYKKLSPKAHDGFHRPLYDFSFY